MEVESCISEHPELLLQLSLKVIPSQTLNTDGSRSDSEKTDSGIPMKSSAGEYRYYFRNPDHSSDFCSELVAIREYLRSLPNILVKLGQDIILKFAVLIQGGSLCLQWIPSPVGAYRYEVADLAGEGSELPTIPSTELPTSEVHSLFLVNMNTTWTPPEYAWYVTQFPGLFLQCSCPRLAQQLFLNLGLVALRV
ncbi:RNase H domain-containing protein [Nephila pilipes]|uniref:RNase H domain-containing protein n=1 Tax=Nephila pilipes TaxID=299642 RepID=A0A8X6UTU8_NEPPI|nr:RNase H domain-containing protein [Nephila pilipes]